jgi:carbonic anhydrase
MRRGLDERNAAPGGSDPPAGPHAARHPVNPDPSPAADAWRRLVEGNQRFVAQRSAAARDADRRREQAAQQTPFAVLLACSDSRVAPELVFDQGIGDLFCVRVAGNTAESDVVLGSLEFALVAFDCPLLVVLGHSDCGAVQASLDLVRGESAVAGTVKAVVEPILPAVRRALGSGGSVDALVEENVRDQTAGLLRSSIVSDGVRDGRLDVVGAIYDVTTGTVIPVT